MRKELFQGRQYFFFSPAAYFNTTIVFKDSEAIVIHEGNIFFIDEMTFMGANEIVRLKQVVEFTQGPGDKVLPVIVCKEFSVVTYSFATNDLVWQKKMHTFFCGQGEPELA